METTMTIKDSRINRDNNLGGYIELCNELVKAQGYDKSFGNGCKMTWNDFKATAYRKNSDDVKVDITLNFVSGEAIIKIDTPEKPAKSWLDEEMELWEARENDEFGLTLKEIKEATADYFPEEETEYGTTWTPISEDITAYSLDGNRKRTAKRVTSVLLSYDLMQDVNIRNLANKMNKIAGL